MLLLGLLAILAVLALDRMVPLLTNLYAARRAAPTNGAPRTFDAALSRIDMVIAGDLDLARTRSGEWMIEERLANAYFARARLTGSFDDFAAAQAALDKAFATAPVGTGPLLTQAVLDFSMHRLGRVVNSLDIIDHYALHGESESGTESAAMRGDIAFYRGDYPRALKLYQGIGKNAAATEDLYRIAVYDAKTGQSDKALAAIDTLESGLRFPTAQLLANLALLRGGIELQRGDWDRATADFTEADRLFPGYWLTEAHLAQMQALGGDRVGAISRFEGLARSSGSPDVMDALAALYRAGGDRERSTLWADRAGTIWEKRLKQFPEAAYGHAVEHYLAFGDPRRALELARLDYAARPYAASSIALAWAFVANNQPADALRAVAPVLRSTWVSADQHIVAGQAHLMLGESDAPDAEQQKALAINPHSMDRDAALIWFGH